ncbi:MAG TPA: phospho-sugar mutase, partial [Spirochaetia bacterium]|nr:phospho-sugar mutase [Spirochaetia bacterium]
MNAEKLLEMANEYLSLETDPHFRSELLKVIDAHDNESLNDRFYTQLSFGTGGLRGVIGGGYNRMNPFMVRRATQGLANYVRKASGSDHPSAVIAYDSRNFSPVFAEEAALVFCANGIKTYLFTSLRPTPELSFAIRRLGATTGIVVTASHNPPAYNGYKVYWADGAQIIHPHDAGIIVEVQSVTTEIRSMDRAAAVKSGMLVMIDREVDDAFVAMVKGHSLRPELIRERGKELKVVYT